MLYISFLQLIVTSKSQILALYFSPLPTPKDFDFQSNYSFLLIFSFSHGYIFVREWCVIKGTVDGLGVLFCGVFGLLLNTLLCLVDCAVRALLWAQNSTERGIFMVDGRGVSIYFLSAFLFFAPISCCLAFGVLGFLFKDKTWGFGGFCSSFFGSWQFCDLGF